MITDEKVYLSEAQLAEYRTKGYVVLRQVFSPDEMRAITEEAERINQLPLVHPKNLRTGHRPIKPNEWAVERIDPVIDLSPLFKKVLADDRILQPLHAIFDEPALLFKDKLIFKIPGMSGYPMHQDLSWWQGQTPDSSLHRLSKDKILSVAIAIDGAEASNGALELFPGYQHTLLSPVGELRNMNAEEIKKVDPKKGELMSTQPGDVIIFHALAPHQSGVNTSERSRRQLYMTYNAASCGDFYEEQQAHYRAYASKDHKEDKDALFFK
jgi:ectoine hydroxylase-related dioxygenase (phytanoyl-CoA dioxygenase family)